MPPALLAPDRQATYRPVWFLSCSAFPRTYATRDIDIPFVVPGSIFTVGDSVVGGEDLIGGGAGPQFKQAYRGIKNTPVVTRSLSDPWWGFLEVQDVTVDLHDPDGELLADYRGAPFTLSAYDAESGFLLVTWTGLVSQAIRNRGETTIIGKNVDLAFLEEEVPTGTITLAEYPLAVDVGACPTWLFGNVKNLPLPCVRDDQVTSEFDYLLCRGDAAALTAVRRVTPGSPTPFIEMTYDELEPYPGMDGVLVNGNMEGWDAGAAVAPDGWTLDGAGMSVAKNITAGQFSEGKASASVTRTTNNGSISQNLMLNAPDLPLEWWRNREITIVVDVRATVASRGQFNFSDGVTTSTSAFHTGGGTFEPLTLGTVSVPLIIGPTATEASIGLRVVSGATTVQFDNVRVYLHAKSWAECLRPDLYPGFTAIRTYLRQDDASGSLYQLVADVHGLQPERNPVRAIRTLLSDTTHSVGKAVDAASFDAAETAACLTYEDAINLDGPEVFLPLRDTFDDLGASTYTILDRSGHERHAVYDKGGAAFHNFFAGSAGSPSGGLNDTYLSCVFGDGDWIAIPDDPAYSTQTPALRISLQISTLPDAAIHPIAEKLVGAATLSGYGLYRESNLLKFFVRGTDTNLYTVTSSLVDVVDEDRWMEIHCEAEAGVLRMYRDGVLAATGTYTSDIAEGAGEVLIAKFGTGSAAVGLDLYDNFALYSHALSAGRIAAHVAALPLGADTAPIYYQLADVDIPATFSYWMSDPLGDTNLGDHSGSGNSGTWTGGPLLGTAPSPLTAERAMVNSGSAARFENDVSKYGVKTGLTLNDAAAAILGFYRPTYIKGPSGLVEKTIGGVRDTQWGFCHIGRAVRFTLVHAGGTLTLDIPLLAEDVGRFGMYGATWGGGTVEVYKNGVLATSGTYTAPVASGVGDFYVGVQGTNGAGLTRPCRGDLARWSYHPSHLTAANFEELWLAATWYNGGLNVDAALREPRAIRTWLEQICLMRGIRLGVNVDGEITCSVDATAPTTIRLHARDGAGDGQRTIKAISDSRWPSLEETVKDVVIKCRRDQLSGTWLVERRRTVHASMGRDKIIELDTIREYPTADRVANYLAARFLAGEKTVEVTMGQEARQLVEGELVQVTDAHMGYADVVMEAKSIRKSLPEHAATVQGWDETPYTYEPTAFPSGAAAG